MFGNVNPTTGAITRPVYSKYHNNVTYSWGYQPPALSIWYRDSSGSGHSESPTVSWEYITGMMLNDSSCYSDAGYTFWCMKVTTQYNPYWPSGMELNWPQGSNNNWSGRWGHRKSFITGVQVIGDPNSCFVGGHFSNGLYYKEPNVEASWNGVSNSSSCLFAVAGQTAYNTFWIYGITFGSP